MEGTGKKSAIHSHHCSSYLPPAEGSSNAQTVWKCWFHLLFSPYNRPSNKFQKSALPSPPLYIPRPLTQYLHGAIEQREHLASQGSKTVHLIQQEAHLFSADPNNPESTEALGQLHCTAVQTWLADHPGHNSSEPSTETAQRGKGQKHESSFLRSSHLHVSGPVGWRI